MTVSQPPPLNPAEPPEQIRRRLAWPDDKLRAECVVHTHRTGGPGGQHRNKTESAVRLHHRPSGLIVTGEERRSQHQNVANALHRLREAIATYFRAPLPQSFAWPPSVRIQAGRLKVSVENPGYFEVVGVALDALLVYRGVPQDAAAYLGVSTTSYVRFLAEEPRIWQEANRLRRGFGLIPLKANA